MRVGHFFFTLFMSTFIMLSTDIRHMLPMYGIAAGLWFIFGLRQRAYNRRSQARKRRAWLQEQYYWQQLRRYRY